jgi:hypothetical protein
MTIASNDWAELPGGVGSVLAVAGDVRVAAELSRLRAWRGHTSLWLAEAPEQNPARPAILADRVCWGPYAVDLVSGALREIPFARPPEAYLPTAHAWSSDGSSAVGAGRRRDPGGSAPPAAAWRLDPTGPTTLWSGDDVAPVAMAVDGEIAVVGHRDPVVHRAGTHPPTVLRAPTPPQRIDLRSGRLLLVGSGELTVWDFATGSLAGRATGAWMDACLTPDGETVLAVDMRGRLVRLPVAEQLQAAAVEPQDAPMTAVATDGQMLLAAFAGLPGLRVRRIA